jgi:hypothetical protein
VQICFDIAHYAYSNYETSKQRDKAHCVTQYIKSRDDGVSEGVPANNKRRKRKKRKGEDKNIYKKKPRNSRMWSQPPVWEGNSSGGRKNVS